MKLRIGTRSSLLALAQTEIFIKVLQSTVPNIEVEVFKIKTTGDILYDQPLADIGGKALFIKEIEEALLANQIDIAVHSMKDMPVDLPQGLKIGCVLPREDRRDAFISLKYHRLSKMPKGAILGTCSARRKFLAKKINDKINVQELRGNVVTRINKLKAGEVDAIILAVSGLKRIGYEYIIKEILSPEIFIPAVAQGIICVETRENDKELYETLSKINHHQTYIESSIEREFLKAVGGDCKAAIGIYTQLHKQYIDFKCFTVFNNEYNEYNDHLTINIYAGNNPLINIENKIKNIFSNLKIQC